MGKDYFPCEICNEATWYMNMDECNCGTEICESCSYHLEHNWMTEIRYGELTIVECSKCTRHPDYVGVSDDELRIHLKEKYHLNIDDIKKDIIDEKVRQYKVNDGVGNCLTTGYDCDINTTIDKPGYYNCIMSMNTTEIDLVNMCDNCSTRTSCSNSSCKFHHEHGGECYICKILNKTILCEDFDSIKFLLQYLKENNKLLHKSWKYLENENNTYICSVVNKLNNLIRKDASINHVYDRALDILKENGLAKEDDVYNLQYIETVISSYNFKTEENK